MPHSLYTIEPGIALQTLKIQTHSIASTAPHETRKRIPITKGGLYPFIGGERVNGTAFETTGTKLILKEKEADKNPTQLFSKNVVTCRGAQTTYPLSDYTKQHPALALAVRRSLLFG